MFPGFRESAHNHNRVGRDSPQRIVIMKLTRFSFLVLGLTLAVIAAPGCRKRPGYVTNIPGPRTGVQDMPPGAPIEDNKQPNSNEPLSQVDPSRYKDYIPNAEIFKANTAYFDF